MSALDRQVGGSHYTGRGVQPVEIWLSCLLGGCESSVIKYLTRWRDKGGVQDLRKAKHFLEIILEADNYQEQFARQRQAYPMHTSSNMTANDYIRANNIPEPEATAIRMVWTWNVTAAKQRLESAANILDELIESAWVER